MSSRVSRTLKTVSDDRGVLRELFKDEKIGQLTLITIKPGKIRGGHYHKKLAFERFTMLTKGSCRTEKNRWMLQGDSVTYYPDQSHSFRNTGRKDITLLVWRPTVYAEKEKDTYYD